MPMLEHALTYAEHAGFALLPVGATCKAGQLAWEGTKSGFLGFHDATRDPDLIRAYWTAYPAANVATHCAASDVFALDVDVKDSAGVGFDGRADLERLQRMHGDLPQSWRTSTPSGGEHRFFVRPAGRELPNRVHMRAPDGEGGEWKTGLDVRCLGAGVPLPPSAKPNGPYRWLDNPFDGAPIAPAPAWLLDLIDPPLPPRAPRAPLKVSDRDRAIRYVEAALDSETAELARMGARSGRNLRLFQAAANLGEFVGANLLPQDLAEAELEKAAQANGLWREDGPLSVRASIKSGMRKGMTHPRQVTL